MAKQKNNTIGGNQNGSKKGGSGVVVIRRSIELVLDTIGEILGFLTAFLILFMCLNGLWSFVPENVRVVLSTIRSIMVIALVLAKGMEFSLKRGWILTIIFGIVCLGIVILMWFPGAMPTWIPEWVIG